MQGRLNHHMLLDLVTNRALSAHVTTAVSTYNVLAGRVGAGLLAADTMPDMAHIDTHVQAARQRLAAYGGGDLPGLPSLPQNSRFFGEMVASEDGGWRRTEPYMRTKDGTALIPVIGSLVNRGAYVGSNSGVTSYEGLHFQLIRAANDPKVKSIILDISSPGGESAGNDDIAKTILAIGKVKPIFGVANALACSAAYAMLSCCTEAYGTSSSLIGSIGVILLHLDKTEQAKAEGVVPTIIHAGEHKADGHAYNTLTPAALAELKAGVNSYYELFTSVVGMGRGRSLTAKKARETEARTFVGNEAKATGLIDDLATFDQVLAVADAYGRRKNGRSAPSTSRGSQSMSTLVHAMFGEQPAPQSAAPQAPAAAAGEPVFMHGQWYYPQAQGSAQPAALTAPQPAPAAPQPQPVQAPAYPQPQQQATAGDPRIAQVTQALQGHQHFLPAVLGHLHLNPSISAEQAMQLAGCYGPAPAPAAPAPLAPAPQGFAYPAPVAAPPAPAPAAQALPIAPPGYAYVQGQTGTPYLVAAPQPQPGLPARLPQHTLQRQVEATGVIGVPAGLGNSPTGVPQGLPGQPMAHAPAAPGYLAGDVPGSVRKEDAPWDSHIARANGRSFQQSYTGKHSEHA